MTEINAIKEKLKHARHAFENQAALIIHREELEKEIQVIQNELEQAQKDSQKELNNVLSQVKKRKQEIDHLLDDWEEWTSDVIQQLEQELINAILSKHPDQLAFFENLKNDLDQQKQRKSFLDDLLLACTDLQNSLEAIISIRKQIQRRWIFSFLFGKNPNTLIAQELEKIIKTCRRILSQEETNFLDSKDQTVYKDFIEYVIRLQEQCKQRWGYKTIDTLYVRAHENLWILQKQFQDQQADAEKKCKLLGSKMENWMQQ